MHKSSTVLKNEPLLLKPSGWFNADDMEDTVHAVSHENKKNTAHGNSGSKVYCLFKWTDVKITITLAFLQIPQHKGCSNHKFLTHLINAVLKQSSKANMLILSIESYRKNARYVKQTTQEAGSVVHIYP